MTTEIPSHQPEQNNSDTNINNLVSSIMANPRLSDNNKEEVQELIQKYEKEKNNIVIDTKEELSELNQDIEKEAKIRVNKLITQYRKKPELHTDKNNSLFNNTIIVKRKTTLKEMDAFEKAMNNVLNPKENLEKVIKNAPLSPDKDREFKWEVKKIKPLTWILTPSQEKGVKISDNFEKLNQLYNSRDEVLFDMTERYLAYEKSEKHELEKDNKGNWKTNIETKDKTWTKTSLENARELNKYLSETGKKELDTLLKLTKDLNIDEAQVWIVWQEPILELDTTWSNIILSIDKDWNLDFSWQSEWELFTKKISYEELIKWQYQLNTLIDNYESKSKEDLIKDAMGIWAMTLGSWLAFLLRTWLSLMISWLWIAFAIEKWIKMYNKSNLHRNESLLLAKELKETKNYEDYKKIMKPYIYWVDNGFIESYDEKDGKYTFNTVDWTTIPWEILEDSIEKRFWTNDKVKWRIENKEESNKYKLLKELENSTIDFEKISENQYDLDFTWLWDDTKIIFDKWKVILETDRIKNKFEYSIHDEKLFEKIYLVDKYLQEMDKLERFETWDDNWFNNIQQISQNNIEKQKKIVEATRKIILENSILEDIVEKNNYKSKEQIKEKNEEIKLGKLDIKATRYFESNDNTENYDVILSKQWNKYILEVDDWGWNSTIELGTRPTNKDIEEKIIQYNLWDKEAKKAWWNL